MVSESTTGETVTPSLRARSRLTKYWELSPLLWGWLEVVSFQGTYCLESTKCEACDPLRWYRGMLKRAKSSKQLVPLQMRLLKHGMVTKKLSLQGWDVSQTFQAAKSVPRKGRIVVATRPFRGSDLRQKRSVQSSIWFESKLCTHHLLISTRA